MRETLFHEDSDPAVVERARALVLERTEDELVTGLEAIRDRPDSTDVWEALAGRRLTIVGDRDPFVPVADARAFDPDAVVLPECGHLVWLERPAEVGQLVDDAVSRWT
jgi:pimeloyl-ACP methyl ester carboxylesterase